MHSIIPLDLNFLHREKAIAAYLIPNGDKAVLVESGPMSTIQELILQIGNHGYKPEDISQVLITHIHLDHAGAAGWFANLGAQIFVHPIGETHLKNPGKLLSSAKRIYGDKMDYLWGQTIPVPEDKVFSISDFEQVKIGDLAFTAIYTPGHAEHHISWLFEDTCFTGDVGGVRMPGFEYIRLPLVPPELNIEKWKQSLIRLGKIGFKYIAPTHFGIFNDADAHLLIARQMLAANEKWMNDTINDNTKIETLRESYVNFINDLGKRSGVEEEALRIYEIANPTWMGADGLFRYWTKIH